MSQWTQISGVIRIDALDLIMAHNGINISVVLENCFGTTVKYNDPLEIWKKCDVPRGSEGSIQYLVERTGRSNELSWGSVVIWGSLRDRGGDNILDEMHRWTNRYLTRINARNISARQVAINVHEEYIRQSIIYLNDASNNELLPQTCGIATASWSSSPIMHSARKSRQNPCTILFNNAPPYVPTRAHVAVLVGSAMIFCLRLSSSEGTVM